LTGYPKFLVLFGAEGGSPHVLTDHRF